MRKLLIITSIMLSSACTQDVKKAETEELSIGSISDTDVVIPSNPERNAYFGDLHVHTNYSFDAFVFGTVATPDDAYRFAKGGALRHPGGFDMKLRQPLDFYAVADHGFYLGLFAGMNDPSNPISNHPEAKTFVDTPKIEGRIAAFKAIAKFHNPDSPRFKEIEDLPTTKSAWKDTVEAANRHNDPGNFTAFVAYEYTSHPGTANLHRNVIFKGSEAPEIPFSRLDSLNPEDLWRWMDGLREEGIDTLAIPHNGNASNGQMFSLVDFSGNPLSESYAELRMRNEPLFEISQIKGTSETHPLLSPNDEWAGFEIYPYLIGTHIQGKINNSYVREAYKNGLALAEEKGFDPFHFGIIGSSDTHNGSYAGDEDNYWGKAGLLDMTGVHRGTVPIPKAVIESGEVDLKAFGPKAEASPKNVKSVEVKKIYQPDPSPTAFSAGGLVGIWAEQNTRDSLFESMQRKETFGTSGTKIRVRFFSGYDLPSFDSQNWIRESYAGGVPMGADLLAKGGQAPEFIIWASRDVHSAPLQRLQIIKGWLAEGKVHEQVYDVACSDGITVDPTTHRCGDNGATVNLDDCSFSEDVGAAELQSRWRDPDFKASERAFYYVRVLENPVCRWSTWDAIRAGVTPREGLAETIQERAWSSPIWYVPTENNAG
ncbi:DUF3604 domain-containing protein [Maricurvus nonylphenolicus]|uniref:DUF3604 domain-containing protein n=1 Tax=Maricurvus nonylphenolicus TaxID=1008307 RepID=UPI0036F2FD92